MTEEEKKAIDYLENLDIDFNTLYRINLRDLDNCKKVILNLIEKQQKEIEEKTTIIMAGAEKVKQLEKEFITKQEIKENYIPKDKIREHIQDLENKKDIVEDNRLYTFGECIRATIESFKSILEED